MIWLPYWTDKDHGAEHGTGYDYDNRVPVFLMGRGIAAGEYLTPVDPVDVAPTLAFLANVTMPRASGRVLIEALSPAARLPMTGRMKAR